MMTGWIADRREAGQRVRGRPCGKCSVAIATPSQGCITFSRRVGWRRKVRIGEAAHRDPVDVGVRSPSQKTLLPARSGSQCHEVVLPQFGQKADLEAAVCVTLINLVVALDPNLAFRISAAGMGDGSGAIADDLSAFGASRREPGPF